MISHRTTRDGVWNSIKCIIDYLIRLPESLKAAFQMAAPGSSYSCHVNQAENDMLDESDSEVSCS